MMDNTDKETQTDGARLAPKPCSHCADVIRKLNDRAAELRDESRNWSVKTKTAAEYRLRAAEILEFTALDIGDCDQRKPDWMKEANSGDERQK